MSVRARGLGPLLALLSVTVGLLPLPSEIRAAEKPPDKPVEELARMLVGTYRGSSPGNDLTIVSTPLTATPTSQLNKLQVRVTGAYNGDAVLLRGLWRISYQGEAVWLVFIPGIDPTAGARAFSDPTFSPTELQAGCWTLLQGGGGGFEGTIKTFPNCRNALGAGKVQSIGKEWIVRFSNGQMRFENRATGEILSFSRAAAKSMD
jgi:hypothetical protein